MSESELLQAMRLAQIFRLNDKLIVVENIIEAQSIKIAQKDLRILELEGQLKTATAQAIHDPLTGLVTRKEMEQQISLHLAALERAEYLVKKGRAQTTEAEQISLLFLDLNGFKRVNDSFGHKAGDTMLETFASALCAHFKRGTDIVCRWGGDEFVVLLGGVTPHEKAQKIADEFLVALSEVSLQLSFAGGAPHTVFVSTAVGVSSTSDGLRTVESLIETADHAMYEHKKQSGQSH